MFDLRRPCKNCPFRKGHGERFQLGRARLEEIKRASAFTCHKTIDYGASEEDGDGNSETVYKNCGPQQCAGLMAVLKREKRDNQIMQVAQRFGVNLDNLDPDQEAYANWADVLTAHGVNNG